MVRSSQWQLAVTPSQLAARCEPKFLYNRKQTAHTFLEHCFRRDETYHEIAIAGEVIKVPRLDQNVAALQQLDSQLFVGAGDGNAQHRVPAALDLQAAAQRLRRELAVEFGEVRLHARL